MTANKMISAPTPLTVQCGFRRTGVTCRSLCWSNSSQAFTTGTSLTIRLRHLESSHRTAPYRSLRPQPNTVKTPAGIGRSLRG